MYADFARLLAAALTGRSIPVREEEVREGVVRLPGPKGGTRQMGLLTLAQMCRDLPSAEWPARIAEFLDSTLSSDGAGPDALAPFQDFEAVRHKLKIRLHPADYMSEHEDLLVRYPIAEGISGLLVCDMGNVNVSVPGHYLKEWGKSKPELFALGVGNVRAAGRIEPEEGPREYPFRVALLHSGSNYAATHALFFEDYMRGGPGYGALLAIPQRHLVFSHVLRDQSMFEAVRFLHMVAEDHYRKGPGSISPHVYWWRPGKLTRVSTSFQEDKFVFFPGEEFERAVLQPLARGN